MLHIYLLKLRLLLIMSDMVAFSFPNNTVISDIIYSSSFDCFIHLFENILLDNKYVINVLYVLSIQPDILYLVLVRDNQKNVDN